MNERIRKTVTIPIHKNINKWVQFYYSRAKCTYPPCSKTYTVLCSSLKQIDLQLRQQYLFSFFPVSFTLQTANNSHVCNLNSALLFLARSKLTPLSTLKINLSKNLLPWKHPFDRKKTGVFLHGGNFRWKCLQQASTNFSQFEVHIMN